MQTNQINNERGEVSIQAVLLVPIILMMFFIGVHMATFAHAAHIANLSASQGAQGAAASSGSAQDTVRVLNEIERTVTDLGSRMSTAPRIYIGTDDVTVIVKLKFSPVVPFLPNFVSRTVVMPRERFMREQDR